MPKRRDRASTPAEIAAAAAAERLKALADDAVKRAEARRVARSPAEWGIDPGQLKLEAANDVHVPPGARQKGGAPRAAVRRDAFDSLLAAGGLTREQHQAARRLMGDWTIRLGVRTDEGSGGGGGPADITAAQIDAGDRIEDALEGVGRADGRLLTALIEPIVRDGLGLALIWRARVASVTGEQLAHAQAGRVRGACDNLRLAYEAIDQERPEERTARREWRRRLKAQRQGIVDIVA